MPYQISWHTTQCLVFCSLFISVLPETTVDRITTSETSTTTTRPPRLCPEPPVPKNGYHDGNKGRLLGTSIKYSCNDGYKLIGPNSFQCLPVGDELDPSEGHKWRKLGWSPDISRIHCESVSPRSTTTQKPEPPRQSICRLPQPKNPYVRIRDWRREYPLYSGVVYTCQRGYVLDGMETRHCMPGGIWYPEEEPECEDEEARRTTVPPTTPGRTETWTIMKIILYISIPLLAVFVLAIVCNMRKQFTKRNRQSSIRSSPDELEDTRYPSLLPTRATGYAGLVAHPYHSNAAPSAPPSNLLNSDEFPMPLIVMDVDPVPAVQKPPSYEEAMRDSSLPSFEAAQKLHNSSTNIYQN